MSFTCLEHMAEISVIVFQNFTSYQKENTAHLHEKELLVMLFMKIIVVYPTNHIKCVNIPNRQHVEYFDVEIEDTRRISLNSHEIAFTGQVFVMEMQCFSVQ
jgi:hypothetical protein